MSLGHLLHPLLHGPTSPVDVRDLLAAHLDWARRVGPPPPAPPADEPGEPLLPPGEGVELQEPTPEERLELLVLAAGELRDSWHADVLDSAPSTFGLGLCAVADRGALLLAGLEDDLASVFAGHRDRLMAHTQGGARLANRELAAAVAELEALVPAVAERALQRNEELARRR